MSDFLRPANHGGERGVRSQCAAVLCAGPGGPPAVRVSRPTGGVGREERSPVRLGPRVAPGSTAGAEQKRERELLQAPGPETRPLKGSLPRLRVHHPVSPGVTWHSVPLVRILET